MNFDQYNFNDSLAAGIRMQGFIKATPIQQKAIPVALENKDIMGLAQTGTGKTGAFAIPVLEKIAQSQSKGIKALIIAPTRELVMQIDTVINELGAKTNIKTTTIFGGANIRGQITRLNRGVDIVVACPGRLLDHAKRRTIDLSKIEMLVLDEADQMFDMGFLPDIKKIISKLPKEKQTMLFSATMSEPIKKLANSVLVKPTLIDINKDTPLSLIKHAAYPVSRKQKEELLLSILKKPDVHSAIIFARTKHRTKKLANCLYKARHNVTSLQGNLSQNRRQEAMQGFRDGKYNIMVATDIAARGLDISEVSHVINFDVPDTTEAYTHRIGRTGRASKTGEAYTFVTSEDTKKIKAIERSLGKQLPKLKIEGFEYKKEERSLETHRPRNKKNSRKRHSSKNASGSRKANSSGKSNSRNGNSKNGNSRKAGSSRSNSRKGSSNGSKPNGRSPNGGSRSRRRSSGKASRA